MGVDGVLCMVNPRSTHRNLVWCALQRVGQCLLYKLAMHTWNARSLVATPFAIDAVLGPMLAQCVCMGILIEDSEIQFEPLQVLVACALLVQAWL